MVMILRFAAGWQPMRPAMTTWRMAAATVSPPQQTKEVADTKWGSSTNEEVTFGSAKTVGAELRSLNDVRMRFAPSPTGSLHVGGARTALYNWLAAKKTGGQFVLRIEDTDVARSTRESEDSMLADLEWLGLEWDEGPRVGGPCGLYRQSERGSIYNEAAQSLVAAGKAYPCFCSEDELETKRQEAKAAGKQVAYDGTWRDADPDEVQRRFENGDPYTIRFKTPPNCILAIDDQIRGKIEWDVDATIGDFILVRSSGVPVYNFVVAVDDATMGISTVVRAEEHLTNTVRQLLVLDALGFPEPRYAHASLILGSDKSKLSKRHGATSCGQFKDQGYLPDAMINYLATLGWNDGTDKEIYSRDELVSAFDINRVVPSPAMFDAAKLKWLNGQHLRAMDVDELCTQVTEFFHKANIQFREDDASSMPFLRSATIMAQPKADLLTDVAAVVKDSLAYPLATSVAQDDKKLQTVLDDGFPSFALAVADSVDSGEAPAWLSTGSSDDDVSESAVKDWIAKLGKRTGFAKKRLFMAARLALTGRLIGPEVPAQLKTLALAQTSVTSPDLVAFPDRIAQLREWASQNGGVAAPPPPPPPPETTDEETTTTPSRATSSSDGGVPVSFEEFKKLRQVYEANRRDLDDDKSMYAALVDAYDKMH